MTARWITGRRSAGPSTADRSRARRPPPRPWSGTPPATRRGPGTPRPRRRPAPPAPPGAARPAAPPAAPPAPEARPGRTRCRRAGAGRARRRRGAVDSRAQLASSSATLPLRGSRQRRVGLERAHGNGPGTRPGPPGSGTFVPRSALDPPPCRPNPWAEVGAEQGGDGLDVLVTATREVEDDQGAGGDPAVNRGLGSQPTAWAGSRAGAGPRCGREAEAVEGEGVGGLLVGDPAGVLPEGVLGTDARVVETGRDRVGGRTWPSGSWRT